MRVEGRGGPRWRHITIIYVELSSWSTAVCRRNAQLSWRPQTRLLSFAEVPRIARGAFTCHGVVLLLQRGGVDDAPEEAPVADGVLLPLVALVQQLVVQEEQLAAQRVKLIQRSRAWGRQKNAFSRDLMLDTQAEQQSQAPEQPAFIKKKKKKKGG